MAAVIVKTVLGGKLIEDGAYAGTLTGYESVRLAGDGMNVSLRDIESVQGSGGDDSVSFSGTLSTDYGLVDLGKGYDHLYLRDAQSYGLRLKGVETVTGVAGSELVLDGKANFSTDGSVAISVRESDSGNQTISFTNIVGNTVIDLGGGRDKVSFGAGYLYSVNAQGELVVAKGGNSLTFDEVNRDRGSLVIEVDGHAYAYEDILEAGFVDLTPPTVVSVQATPDLISDSEVGASTFAITVTFNEAMRADGLANPVLAFSQNLTGTLTLTASSWNPAGTAYTATYSMADAGVDFDSVTVGVTGAVNAALLPQQAYTAQVEFSVDTLNPTVVTLTENNVDGVVSDADNVVAYTVTFSEAVASLAASDLNITGGTLTTGPQLAVDGLSATFSVTATDNSTADLVVGLKSTIVDAGGNALAASSITLAVDTVNPSVSSITRETPATQITNADSLVYRITFSEPVTQVSADDFAVAGTTATATGVSAVSASVYDVTVSGGDLAGVTGLVTLGFAPAQDIVDAAGQALSSTTPTGANESFSVDNAVPVVAVTTVSQTSATTYTVTGTGFDSLGAPGTVNQFDFSKLWLEVDGSGTPSVAFTAADVASMSWTDTELSIVLQAAKADAIEAAVDGTNDLFVIAEGFWADSALNIQLVGGNYSASINDFE